MSEMSPQIQVGKTFELYGVEWKIESIQPNKYVTCHRTDFQETMARTFHWTVVARAMGIACDVGAQ